MKKNFKLILVMFSMLLVTILPLHAASPSVSISFSAKDSNNNVTVYINNDASGNFSLTGTLTISGVGSGSTRVALPGAGSESVTVKVNSSGTLSASFSGEYSEHGVFVDTPINTSNSTSVTVGGGSSAGDNSNGTYNPEMPLGETEEERIAREAREKAEQLERDKKIPLIESIEIISNDEKRNGKVLSTLTTKEETFDYSYSLPSFISKVSLKVNGTSDDVTLDFEKDHEITGDKEIIVNASKGEISQEFTLKLTAPSLEDTKVEDGFVYSDDELTKSFKDLGFELKEYELDGKKSSMFNKNELNLQMIVNDDRETLFYRLDEKGNVLDKGQIIVHEKDVLFVLSEADEELQNKKLYGNNYSSVELPKPAFLDDVDETLKIKQVASGWEFEEGVVVVALDDALEKDLYHVVADQPFKSAVVAFDGQTSPVVVYALITSLIALIGVSIAFIVYYLNSKKKIQMLLSRN